MAELKAGDIVITPTGIFAMLVRINSNGLAAIRMVQNGPLQYREPHKLRRATLDQIANSLLSGVGCNQAMEGVNG